MRSTFVRARHIRTSVLRAAALASAAGLVSTLGACRVGPDYQGPPAVETPDAFDAAALADAAPAGDVRTAPTAGEAEVSRWWAAFDDPMLTSLVERALAANLDLRTAAARVTEARALAGVARADLLPSVDAAAGVSRSRNSENTQQGGFTGGEEQDLFRAGFDASWELDFFGRVRRGVDAAFADYEASVEDLRDVRVTLTAEVATAYAELRGAQQRLAVARRSVAARVSNVELAEARFKARLVSELDVAQARAEVATRRAIIPALEAQVRQTIHRLSVLLGRPPAALVDELSPDGAIPAAPTSVMVGLPSDLLRRRPDIRRAERQLAAQVERVGAATADLFPRFSLTGSFFQETNNVAELVELNSRSWSIGPSLRWPVFDRGRLTRAIEAQTARESAAAAAYERAVLGAFADVDNALTGLVKEQSRRVALRESVAANSRVVELATTLYTAQLTDFREVLDSQRQLFDAEDQLVQSDLAVTTSLIALYKALGGGWSEAATAEHMPERTPAP